MIKTEAYKPISILLAITFLSLTISPGPAWAFTLVWEEVQDYSSDSDVAFSITEDTDYLYIAGYDKWPGDGQWRIEKRRKSDGGREWWQPSNPSSGDEEAYSITQDTNYLYIAGSDRTAGDFLWRIEKRNKSNGSLVIGFGSSGVIIQAASNGNCIPYAITAAGNYIYIAGAEYNKILGKSWRIEKRNKSDGSLVDVENDNFTFFGNNSVRSITADSQYIYVAGWEYITAGDWQWRIEKRRQSDLVVDQFATPNPSSGQDRAWAIAADNDYLYTTGVTNSPSTRWHIEKHRKSDLGLEWAVSEPSYMKDSFSITATYDYIYITGADPIEKRRKSDGGVEWATEFNPPSTPNTAWSIIEDVDYIYLAGFDLSPGNLQWHIEKRSKLPYVDIGLRVYDQNVTEPIEIATEPGAPTSPLRISKDTDGDGTPEIYGIVLVDPGDSMDSGVRIQIEAATGPEIKALRRL